MKNSFKLLIMAGILAFTAQVSAVTVEPEAFTIDFGTGIGTGGTVELVGPGDVHGTDIFIGALNVSGAPVNNGGYTVNALLNFDTDQNTISIVGTVGALGITESQVLLSGSFEQFSFEPTGFGGIASFTAGGIDTKSDDLLLALGAPLDTEFEYFGFSLTVNGDALSTDILNTAVAGGRDIPQVPVPAAAWLFGSGLIGMVGVARRKKTA